MEYYALLHEVQKEVRASANAYNEGDEGLALSRMETLRDLLDTELPLRSGEEVKTTGPT